MKMNDLNKAIDHFEKQGYTIVSFNQYVEMLNKAGYNLSLTTLKEYRTINSEQGHIYYTTSCTFLGTNIGYANIAGMNLRTKEGNLALKELRDNFMFTYNKQLYCI